MSVIYITHDLGLVAEIADKVIVMYKGEMVEVDTIKEIFLNPQHPYTKALIKLPAICIFKRKTTSGNQRFFK